MAVCGGKAPIFSAFQAGGPSGILSVGLTFDTGALIALERRHQRMARVYATAVGDGILITVPAVVIVKVKLDENLPAELLDGGS